MLKALNDNWALLLGILLLMISNGLLSTLLTIRGASIGFSEVTIGIMQAGYPLGALLGAIIAPKLVEKVGHIRSFAALASLCSVAAIAHLLTDDPFSWSAMRFLAGFCFPGLFVVSESWLNANADNTYRGGLLSIYFVVISVGSSIGAAIAGLENSNSPLLFGATSILISISLIPILVSDNRAPTYVAPERLALSRLLRISPLAIIGSALNGVLVAGIYISLPLFALSLGFTSAGAALLLVTATFAGAIFQFPLGWLSDQIDRRLVVAGASITAAVCASGIASGYLDAYLYVAVGLMAGLLLPIYSICVAHANDNLSPAQIVPASGTLVLTLNVGILIGALIGPAILAATGPTGLMIFFASVTTLTAVVALIRIAQSDPPAERRVAQPVSAQVGQMVGGLHPEAETTKQD